MSFVIYDLETTGTHKAFDQILQFAGMRVDPDLEEIDRFESRCRLLPHVVPSPGAMHVTGISLEQMISTDLPTHYEMISTIREYLSGWCPSIFIGYNSIKFDEEFLRRAFYQCLHPPYLTNTNGSARADVKNLVRTAAVLHPEALVIPIEDTGRASFKLDRIAPANGFSGGRAHDAMGDVEATLHVCRIIRDRCPDLWSRFVRYAQKSTVADFVRYEDAFVLFENFGANDIATVVTRVGSNPVQSNIAYCLDVEVDRVWLKGASDEEVAGFLTASPKPIRRLKVNAAPVICSLDEVPPQILRGRNPDELAERGRAIREDRALIDRLVAHAAAAERVYDRSPHVEEQIYDGHWSDDDTVVAQRWHRAPWPDRLAISEEFEDPRLKRLARRLIYFERPDLFDPSRRRAIEIEVAKRMIGDGAAPGEWLTLEGALAQIEGLLPGLSGPASERLVAYQGHLRGRVEVTRTFLAS